MFSRLKENKRYAPVKSEESILAFFMSTKRLDSWGFLFGEGIWTECG